MVLSDTTEIDTLHTVGMAFLLDISHDHCGCSCALLARLLYQLENKVVLSAKFSEYSILCRQRGPPFVRSLGYVHQRSHLLHLLMSIAASRERRIVLRFCAMVVGYGRGSPLPRAVYFPCRIVFLQPGQTDAATNYVIGDLAQAKYAKWAAFLKEMAMEKILQEAQDRLDMEDWRTKSWGQAIVLDTWRCLQVLLGLERM